MKLVVDAATRPRASASHMVGPDAAEIIQGLGHRREGGRRPRPQFDATVGIHPTAAEEFVTMKDKRVMRAAPRG